MLTRFKTFFTGLSYVWKYGDTLTAVLKRIAEYPGITDSDKLRRWIRPIILDFSVLTSLTKNTIDDVVSRTAIQIIDNDNAWNAIHSLTLLANDNQSNGAVKVVEGKEIAKLENFERRSDAMDICLDVANEIQAENPAIIIAAIGLIIQLVQFLRKK